MEQYENKSVGDDVTTWINDLEMIKIKDSIIGKGIGGVALQIHDGGGIKGALEKFKDSKALTINITA